MGIKYQPLPSPRLRVWIAKSWMEMSAGMLNVSSVAVRAPWHVITNLLHARLNLWALLLILMSASVLSGCASLEYYWQSARGHMEVLAARKPIRTVLDDPLTPQLLRRRLMQVTEMVRFAERELGLPNHGSYQEYADIGRDFVVWTVVAAPRLSLKAKRWCYPMVGCLSYRGFHVLAQANRFAHRLREQDFDVYIAPVRVYSTLGWFADPVLNTLMHGPEWNLAGVIFHELSHQKLYLAGDTDFNEAYAVAVQREGERRWLAGYGDSRDREHYQAASTRRRAFYQLVTEYRNMLESLYQSPGPRSVKLAARERIFKAMRAAYSDLKSQWRGYPGYDRWFGQDLNNAKLALAATYNKLVPGFAALIKHKGGNMHAFNETVAQLAGLTPAQRRRRLQAWLAAVEQDQ